MSVRTIGSAPDYVAALPAAPAAASEHAPKRPVLAAENPQPAATSEVGAEQVKAAISKIQKVIPMAEQNLQFSVDDETGKTIVSVTDKTSGELIRQIPSEEIVEIARSIGRIQGLLVNSQA